MVMLMGKTSASCRNFAGIKALALFIPDQNVYLSKMTATCWKTYSH